MRLRDEERTHGTCFCSTEKGRCDLAMRGMLKLEEWQDKKKGYKLLGKFCSVCFPFRCSLRDIVICLATYIKIANNYLSHVLENRLRTQSDTLNCINHNTQSVTQRYQANGSHCEAKAVLTCPKPNLKVNLVPRPKHNTAFLGFTRVNNQGERNNTSKEILKSVRAEECFSIKKQKYASKQRNLFQQSNMEERQIFRGFFWFSAGKYPPVYADF
ncbi:hypothetical protein TNCV_4171081 [Trichonephila clavipes]|nr:hypothetical protein TNCV_4171081 [Trichonephila clavipes]